MLHADPQLIQEKEDLATLHDVLVEQVLFSFRKGLLRLGNEQGFVVCLRRLHREINDVQRVAFF